ncbi:TPA: hypothetical protein QDE31_01650 [Burkholderia cenocepacia]|nr:hypothetical protein [Burkholderia cenocepacia]
MTLGELLEELRFNVLRDRSDLIAGDTDSLWSDETLLRYIKDAERRFARQTLILRDSTTPEVVQVKMKQGVTTYPLHPSVLSVLTTTYTAPNGGPGPYDLQRSGHSLIFQSTPAEAMVWNPAEPYNATLPPGPPLAYYTDETLVYARQSRVTLSLYPTPGANEDGQIVYMRVVRLPMGHYNKECLDRESEIPEDYQLDVLEWAAYRAQRTFDGDAGAPTSADQHKAAFAEAVQDAKDEVKRKIFAPTQIRYGANGSSWTR